MSNSDKPLFCPRCATENAVDQGYCRQCGQGLFGIQWVLDGRIAELRKRLEAADKWIKAGNTTLIAFIAIGVMISALGIAIGNPTLSIVAMINVLAGALIGFPFVFIGNARLIKAKRLISQSPMGQRPGIQGALGPMPALAQTTRLHEPTNQGSVTEHTTLHLSHSEPAHRWKSNNQS